MRTLGWISSGIALLGLVAYFVLQDATPSFVIPLVLVSGSLAIFFVFASIIVNKRLASKEYHCVKCGARITGGDPTRYGSVCPNCGGHVFR
jgi:DNA-directed RNA polymerase subunit RPC12/RpoP